MTSCYSFNPNTESTGGLNPNEELNLNETLQRNTREQAAGGQDKSALIIVEF